MFQRAMYPPRTVEIYAAGSALPEFLDFVAGHAAHKTGSWVNYSGLWLYRASPNEKVGDLKLWQIDGSGPAAGNTIAVYLGLYSSFADKTYGDAFNKAGETSRITSSEGSIADITLTATAQVSGSLAANPINKAAWSNGGSKVIRWFNNVSWTRRDNDLLFGKTGLDGTLNGSILIDFSFNEWLALSVKTLPSTAAGLFASLKTEVA